MFKTLRRYGLFAVLMTLVLAACEEEIKDPYTTVTLRELTRGSVISKGFKYKLVNPEIIALNRNLGIIREGNILEFIGARSLEDKLEGVVGQNFELAVHKQFSPYVHFQVDRVYTEAGDTIFLPAAGGIAYPAIRQASEFSTDAYEATEIDKIPYNNTMVLKNLVDKKILLDAKVTQGEEEGRTFYMLEGASSKLRIVDPPEGTALILKILAKNNHPFQGGVRMTEIEPFGSRSKTRIAGSVEVQFVRYNTTIVSG